MHSLVQKLCFKLVMVALVCFLLPTTSQADDDVSSTLPLAVAQQAHSPMTKVGTGIYRKLGFNIYRATLWAPDGIFSAKKPYALELHYNRNLSKDTLVSTVMDDIRNQKVTDDTTLTQWEKTLDMALPAVEDGDIIIGLAVPGKKSTLYFNGKETTSIADPIFSSAFFNIWLGDHADENLRNKLLANAQ